MKKQQTLPKSELIKKIIVMNNSMPDNQPADANMFFSLAFMTDNALIEMCKKLNIKTTI